MKDFWDNISRYPRFFISSLAGLILVILRPLKNLFKVPKLRIFLIISMLIFGGILVLILRSMSGI